MPLQLNIGVGFIILCLALCLYYNIFRFICQLVQNIFQYLSIQPKKEVQLQLPFGLKHSHNFDFGSNDIPPFIVFLNCQFRFSALIAFLNLPRCFVVAFISFATVVINNFIKLCVYHCLPSMLFSWKPKNFLLLPLYYFSKL